MSRLWPEGEPISVQIDDRGRPLRFTWRNRTYRLAQIQQHWQVDADWWSDDGRIWREYLAVITVNGLLCVLYQDLLAEEWFLSKLYD
jgi:hypothetical protein